MRDTNPALDDSAELPCLTNAISLTVFGTSDLELEGAWSVDIHEVPLKFSSKLRPSSK